MNNIADLITEKTQQYVEKEYKMTNILLELTNFIRDYFYEVFNVRIKEVEILNVNKIKITTYKEINVSEVEAITKLKLIKKYNTNTYLYFYDFEVAK